MSSGPGDASFFPFIAIFSSAMVIGALNSWLSDLISNWPSERVALEDCLLDVSCGSRFRLELILRIHSARQFAISFGLVIILSLHFNDLTVVSVLD